MNYFQLFNISQNLIINPSALQNTFYTLCRKYHPDVLNNQVSEISIDTVNIAYQVLSNNILRLEYILKLQNIIKPDNEKVAMPSNFLIEMFEINEKIDDFKNDPSSKNLQHQIQNEIETFKEQITIPIKHLTETDKDGFDATELNLLKDFYLKYKYLQRLENGVNNED